MIHNVYEYTIYYKFIKYTVYIVYSSGVFGSACLNEQQLLAVVEAFIFPVWLTQCLNASEHPPLRVRNSQKSQCAIENDCRAEF